MWMLPHLPSSSSPCGRGEVRRDSLCECVQSSVFCFILKIKCDRSNSTLFFFHRLHTCNINPVWNVLEWLFMKHLGGVVHQNVPVYSFKNRIHNLPNGWREVINWLCCGNVEYSYWNSEVFLSVSYQKWFAETFRGIEISTTGLKWPVNHTMDECSL